MRKLVTRILLIGAIMSATAAWAQSAGGSSGNPDANAADKPAEKPPLPMAGFWPTETMVQRVLDRIAESAAEHYDFDDEQMLRMRETMDRFPKWMQENRGEVQGLMNEYFEALLDKEAPTPDAVAKWAQRVMPLIKSFDGLVDEVAEDMRSYMTDEQRVLLEGEMAGFKMGMGLATNKISSWADGNYDPENEWIGSQAQKDEMKKQDIARARAMKAARDSKIEELGGDPKGHRPSEVVAKKGDSGKRDNKPAAGDEWVKYTEDFIKRYQLDDKQTEQARNKLKTSIEERDTFKLRIASDLERVEKKLRDAKTDAEKKAAKAENESVRRPLERRFSDFKNALDKIPTSKQKRDAALQEAKRDTKSKPDKTKPADADSKTAGDAQPADAKDGASDAPKESKREELAGAGAEGAKKEGPSSP